MKYLFSDRRNDEIVCINLVERKNIERVINAALIARFINTALIIYSSIYIFHLYMNSAC
jgi:hypothetical protein